MPSCNKPLWTGLGSGVLGTADTGSALKHRMLVTCISMRVRHVGGLLLQEVGVREGREGGGLVDDGGVVDLFVDANGVVHGGGLDGLALDDGLHCIVSVRSCSSFHTTRVIRPGLPPDPARLPVLAMKGKHRRTGLVDVVVLVLLLNALDSQLWKISQIISIRPVMYSRPQPVK